MKLLDYINGMTEEEQNCYAERCGTTGGYLRAHIKHARKTARKELMEALARESEGKVSDYEVFQHFFSSSSSAA